MHLETHSWLCMYKALGLNPLNPVGWTARARALTGQDYAMHIADSRDSPIQKIWACASYSYRITAWLIMLLTKNDIKYCSIFIIHLSPLAFNYQLLFHILFWEKQVTWGFSIEPTNIRGSHPPENSVTFTLKSLAKIDKCVKRTLILNPPLQHLQPKFVKYQVFQMLFV